jgi:hypothetical protein
VGVYCSHPARRSREAAENALADLGIEKARVDGERKAVVEADLGPVRYLATLIGSTDEQTMRWFTLVVAPPTQLRWRRGVAPVA